MFQGEKRNKNKNQHRCNTEGWGKVENGPGSNQGLHYVGQVSLLGDPVCKGLVLGSKTKPP